MNELLDTNTNLGKPENFEALVGNSYLPVEVDDEQRAEFLNTLKEGVKLLEKIIKEGDHEHDYNEVCADTCQLYPTDPTKSSLIDEDDYDPEDPVSYLEVVYSNTGAFEVILSSLGNSDVKTTVIDSYGERNIANDTMLHNLCLSEAIYAALMDFWLVHSPNAYDMPFVINLLLNAIKDSESHKKGEHLTSSFEKALIQDMATIDSELTFSSCYSKEVYEGEPLINCLPM
tara:strand:+ start:16967 stop:17656 length:690 start_codon:yes stop_codon:yes gene_type:complete